jgi:DedD protein
VNTLGKHDRDLDDYTYNPPQDREISLGTGTILGMFFALAAVCAIFFGFGYTMGRKSAATALNATATSAGDTTTVSSGSSAKPSSGSLFQTAPQSAAEPTATENAPATDTADASAASDPAQAAPEAAPQPAPAAASDDTTTTVVRDAQQAPAKVKDTPHITPVAAQKPAPAAAQPPAVAISSTGTTMVQIAAVSHQEDADLLLSALKKRGYPVFIRQEAQDHLLHIQVGPFATHKDADVMRQRLLNDGYNAIIK